VLARVLHVEPVDVAEALGYPTRPRGVVTAPIPAAALEACMTDLSARLEREIAAWAKESFATVAE
jgi:hypothetical protein